MLLLTPANRLQCCQQVVARLYEQNVVITFVCQISIVVAADLSQLVY
jgi:hypothetical protein